MSNESIQVIREGIAAPKKIVVINTISNTEVLIIFAPLSYYPPSIVNIRAKATDPLIVPAIHIINS